MNRDDLGTRIEQGLEEIAPRPVSSDVIASRARRRRTRRRGAMSAVLAIAAIAVVAILVAGGPSDGPLGPPTVEASAQITLPGRVVSTASEGGYLWVLTCSTNCGGPPSEQSARGELAKVDSSSGAIVTSTEVMNPSLVAAGEGGVWTASFSDGVVTRFDPETLKPVGEVQLTLPKPIAQGAPDALSYLPNSIVVGEGSVWVGTARGYVAQIDPTKVEVKRMIALPYPLAGMAVAGGYVWLSAELFGLGKIDPKSGQLSPPQPIEGSDGYQLSTDYLTVADESLWVRGGWAPAHRTGEYTKHPGGDIGLARLNPENAEVEEAVSFSAYIAITAVSETGLWLSGHDVPGGSQDVYVFSPGAEAVDLAAHLAEPGTVIGAVGDSLWVARSDHVVQRYDIPAR